MRPRNEKIKLKSKHKGLVFVNKWLRESKKTWSWLIDEIDYDRQVARMWLLGHKQPSVNGIYQLSKVTGVDFLELLGKEKFDLKRDNDCVKQVIPELYRKNRIDNTLVNYYTFKKIVGGITLHPEYGTLMAFKEMFDLDSITDLLEFKE